MMRKAYNVSFHDCSLWLCHFVCSFSTPEAVGYQQYCSSLFKILTNDVQIVF